MGFHGFMVMAAAGVLLGLVLRSLDAPKPPESRLNSHYDDPARVGITLALVWAVIGMGVGVWVAAMLAWPEFRFDAA